MAGVPDYLESWMTKQRWYAGKSRAPQLQVIGGFGLAAPNGAAVIRVYLVLDDAEHPLLYQVPLTERSEPLDGAENALVASFDVENGRRYIYDGPHDPAFAEALLRMILDDGEAHETDGPAAANSGGPLVARGHHTPDSAPVQFVSSRVLGGEQSNSSIIFQVASPDGTPSTPIICKLFRAIHHGENPDVTLTEALGAAGSTVAPRSIGHVTGLWTDSGMAEGIATGHLAFAQEFLPGVEDAWRVAVHAAEVGEDFTERARALGVTTAEMHETLRSALPSRATTPSDIATTVASMRYRFELAAAEVPGLSEYRPALERVYHEAAASPWPALQRIHGDFHLGQVLAVPGRGWVVLDFEGEPMRPMSERSLPDIPLRDVAGMLRSFDYVAGSFALSHPGESAAAWASACRRAFVDGYIERSGRDLREHRAVLDAFEIDKALYEAVYEARNRPGWLAIPTLAITRLIERSATP
ncbi:trehalose biosynthesis protein [soil metagenome]